MILTREFSSKISATIAHHVNVALKRKGLSARRASIDVVGHDGLIRDIRAGRIPSADRLLVLFQYLNISLDVIYEPSTAQLPSFSEFSSTETLPHIGFASCSVQGWGKPQPEAMSLPKPAFLDDPSAFFITARGTSMAPEGISAGTFCAVSPAQNIQLNDRVWIKEKGGKAAIKRLIHMTSKSLVLRGWMPAVDGKQQSFEEERVTSYIERIYPVVAVYKGKPGTGQAHFIPDPTHTHIFSETPDVPKTKTPHCFVPLTPLQASRSGEFYTDDPRAFASVGFPKSWLAAHGLNPKEVSLIFVNHSDMAPTLPKGAIALIDLNKTKIEARKIYAFQHSKYLHIKRLEQVNPKTVIAFTDSPTSKSEIITDQKADTIRILGEVVWTGYSLIN